MIPRKTFPSQQYLPNNNKQRQGHCTLVIQKLIFIMASVHLKKDLR